MVLQRIEATIWSEGDRIGIEHRVKTSDGSCGVRKFFTLEELLIKPLYDHIMDDIKEQIRTHLEEQ